MATHSSILAWRIPMDRRAWQTPVHRVAKSRIRLKRLSMHSCSVDMTLKTLKLDRIKWYVWSDERRASAKAKEMGRGQPGRGSGKPRSGAPGNQPSPPKQRICRRSRISQVSDALPRDKRDENQDVGEGRTRYCCSPLSSKPWSIWTTG